MVKKKYTDDIDWAQEKLDKIPAEMQEYQIYLTGKSSTS